MRERRPGVIDEVDVDVRVHGLATGGDAVGRQVGGAHDGRATFIPLAAPGDEVRARVVRQQARVAWAELSELRTASPARVTPPCPFFGACGGCQWQHVALATQRDAKRDIVARALRLPTVRLEAPVASGFGYRDRARVVVGARGALGFRARHSHDVVDIDRCLLLGAEASAAFTALRGSAPSLPPDTELDLQAGVEGVHVTVHARDDGQGARWLAAWRDAGVVGVRVVGRGVTPEHASFGASDVDVAEEKGPPLRIPSGGFAQVGRVANEALVRTVMSAVGATPGTVLELYAGSGNFTRHLVGVATSVLACDADGAAVERGRRNVPGATWARQPPVARDAETVLADPPREGLDGENFAAARAARRRLIYVSCDPQTLGRDAVRLAAQGFVLRDAVALDLMSHTFHVEVVATFERT